MHLKRNIQATYKLAKEVAVDVPKHCNQFLRASIHNKASKTLFFFISTPESLIKKKKKFNIVLIS